MKWAYGWENWDNTYEGDKEKMEWKNKINKEMEEAGIENLGRLTQKDVAKLYLEGNVMLYPTEFAEIDCITVKKAQACGCLPITTDFGALEESVQYGVKIPSKKTKDNWAKPFQFSFGVETQEQKQKLADAVVEVLKRPIDDRAEMKEWAKKFSWEIISDKWIDIIK
jgi:glycosyltransferase involved in cell wall biosynthesis